MDPSVGSVGRIGTVTALKKQPWGSRTPVQAPVWAAGELNAKVAALRVVNEEVISTRKKQHCQNIAQHRTYPSHCSALDSDKGYAHMPHAHALSVLPHVRWGFVSH